MTKEEDKEWRIFFPIEALPIEGYASWRSAKIGFEAACTYKNKRIKEIEIQHNEEMADLEDRIGDLLEELEELAVLTDAS